MLPIRITMHEMNWPSKRAFSRASKEAHRDMGEHYHKVMIPKHFMPGGDRTYRMRPRQPGYKTPAGPGRTSLVWRAVQRGIASRDALTHPLVFTGRFRDTLTKLASIRPYPS